MNFVNIPTIDSEGNEVTLPINPDNVIWIEKTGIPSAVAGAPDSPGTMIVFIGGIGHKTKLPKDQVKSLLETGRIIDDKEDRIG